MKKDPARLDGCKVKHVARTGGLKLILEEGSRGLLPPLGAEPVVRAYTEACDEKDMVAQARAAENFVQG